MEEVLGVRWEGGREKRRKVKIKEGETLREENKGENKRA